MSLPRILTLMGSGETSPTMVKTHRELFARIGSAPAVLLDTPFGFQANAPDLTARAQTYFRDSVGRELALASYTSSREIGTVAYENALTAIRNAGYVFAGPGSPTYALQEWAESAIPQVLRSKLVDGGCVTFASAAALTMGIRTVPVYEIYKVGAPAEWADGLDLLRETGLSAAVIPHYNNAEGGNHDTRYCYLGEPRLAVMEQQLPDGAFVLGIDEHTGLVLDLAAETATVVGIGAVTVRAAGQSETIATGTTLAIGEISEMATRLRTGAGSAAAVRVASPVVDSSEPQAGSAGSPLLDGIAAREAEFASALAAKDVQAAAQALLDLEADLHAWSADTLQSDELDQGRAAVRSMVVRLAALAETGAQDPRDLVGPFVESLLEMRKQARADKRYADSDAVRDQLVALGVEVRDTPGGTEWELG